MHSLLRRRRRPRPTLLPPVINVGNPSTCALVVTDTGSVLPSPIAADWIRGASRRRRTGDLIRGTRRRRPFGLANALVVIDTGSILPSPVAADWIRGTSRRRRTVDLIRGNRRHRPTGLAAPLARRSRFDPSSPLVTRAAAFVPAGRKCLYFLFQFQ